MHVSIPTNEVQFDHLKPNRTGDDCLPDLTGVFSIGNTAVCSVRSIHNDEVSRWSKMLRNLRQNDGVGYSTRNDTFSELRKSSRESVQLTRIASCLIASSEQACKSTAWRIKRIPRLCLANSVQEKNDPLCCFELSKVERTGKRK